MDSLKKLKMSADYHAGNILLKRNEQLDKQRRTRLKFVRQLNIIFAAVLRIMATSVPVFASGESYDTAALFGRLLGIVVSLFRWVGIVLLVWGVCQFLLAIKRSDSESKSDAIQTIVCAVALIVIRTLIDALGLGVDISEPDNM